MSMIDFIILGFVMERPSGAYDVVKAIEHCEMNQWVRISNPAVYKNTPKLAEKGYLTGQKIKEGEMPEKIVYTITKKGHEYFFNLMDKFTVDIGGFNLGFTPILMNIGKADPEKGREILRRMKANICRKKEILEKRRDQVAPFVPPTGTEIIRLYHDLFGYLENWIDDFEAAYLKEQKEGRPGPLLADLPLPVGVE